VSSSPDNSGKTVSTATEASSDAAPAESDLGVRDAELATGDGPEDADSDIQKAPEPFSGGGGSDAGPTAGPDDKQV
jgi:hypothetical protein